ncbi:MAG: Bax inhibitor-1/YccA family protein [Flavobacteriales bacterium]|nr:Bax inhibitor-1/YccA family protein [Flavobacteriales bacterium]
MENITTSQQPIEQKALAKNFVANVFSMMFIALIVSGITAFWFASSGMVNNLFSETGGMNALGWIIMLAPLGLVMLMGFGFQKLSVLQLMGVFMTYSLLTGMSLSFIFLVYSAPSIVSTFFISAITFGIMAFAGYTTKTDLTKMGSLLFMALIGIVIASVINLFIGSGPLDYIISIVGVLVFTGLTAYDVQKIKRIGAGIEHGTASSQKLMIMGALTLYLDFINLFLMLLRLLGNRN